MLKKITVIVVLLASATTFAQAQTSRHQMRDGYGSAPAAQDEQVSPSSGAAGAEQER